MNDEKWFENPSFWRDMRPKIYSTVQETAARTEVAEVLQLLGTKQSSIILDMCCGNGRHAIELSLLGHDVTGVDLNEEYIEEGRAQAASRDANPTFVKADLRAFESETRFDAALILWNAFGYFCNDSDDLRALKSMHRALRSGGKLLIQTHGSETTARKIVRKDWFEIGETIVLDQRWIDDDWSSMRTRYVIISPTSRHEYTMSCRLYSPRVLGDLLANAGFTDIRFLGGLDGRAYDEKAFELVAIATKRV